MFLVPVPPYENPTVAPGNIWTFYRQSWINPDFTALSPHESDQPGSVKVFLLWIRCFSFSVFGTDIILTVVNIPIKLSPVLNSSPWSSNCSHRPKNIDPFPLPPTLTVSPTACGPEPGRCCPGKPSLQTRSDRLEAGKATDFRFTYTVRLSPSPVWQLSGTSVKLNHNKPTLLPLTAFRNKSFCWRPRYVRLDFKIK